VVNPAPITLRAAALDDVGIVADFNQAMALQTEGQVLPRPRLEAGVAALIEDPRRGFYLLAERDGEVVGQAMVTYEWSDWRNADFWWIQSVYVTPAHRRTGVYSALHREVSRRASESEACGIRLYVERDNTDARATYERLGMSPSHYDMYEQPVSLRK
jgi:GNAT superfamily N-acetyltransferase